MTTQQTGTDRDTPARLRRHWRFRINTFMLLILVFGLALALVIEQRKRQVAEERARAAQVLAQVQADEARMVAELVRAKLNVTQDQAEGASPVLDGLP